jgi:cell wall-associated NlpC family hydrolase
MTTTRTPTSSRRSLRAAVLTLATGAGIALTPVAASAAAGAPAPVAAVAVAPAAAPSHATQVAVDTALAQQGKPYVWGGTGPAGYDCSGLTSSAYKAAGVTIPRTSKAQSTAGVHVDRAHLRPGDLIFFYDPVGHVGMYIGNGQMVHSSTYGQPVKVVPVDSMPGYNTARRVGPAAAPDPGGGGPPPGAPGAGSSAGPHHVSTCGRTRPGGRGVAAASRVRVVIQRRVSAGSMTSSISQ